MENRKYTGLEIAVIGMSVKTPGAKTLDQFWENLKNGVESVEKLSDEHLLNIGVPKELLENKDYVKAASYLKDKEYFDSKFFGYRKEEAMLLNPQTRIFMQCVWEALEDAACIPDQYKGKIGLFAGAKSDINWENYSNVYHSDTTVDEFSRRIYRKVDYICTSIAYKLNLKGPAVFVNSACSTSLVAIHMAVMSLLTGESDVAVAGGITAFSAPPEGYMYKDGMINSSDGHCRPFDEKADGIVPAEGSGAVVLKRLDQALEDGDNIYAIIKGSAINNDGSRKVGYTTPSVVGQTNVIKTAQKISRVKPESISYIEAHGTGTALGDPVEMEALIQAFGKSQKPYCTVGAVKSNLGHADSAAGVIGFIKTVLALKNRQIPPTLHYEKLNRKIQLSNTPFTINDTLKEWKSESAPLRAGVSSFGIGGTNAHIILEEGITKEVSEKEKEEQLLIFSAETEASLTNMIREYKEFLKKNTEINLADLGWTLQQGRKRFSYRTKVVAKDVQEAIDELSKVEADPTQITKMSNSKKKVVFKFQNAKSHTVNMSRNLYEQETLFQEKMKECFAVLKEIGQIDLKTILYPEKEQLEDSKALLKESKYSTLAIFAVEYAKASVFLAYGVKPDYMLANGIGEFVAACMCGLFNLEAAFKFLLAINQYSDVEDMKNSIDNTFFEQPSSYWISGNTGNIVEFNEIFFMEYWWNLIKDTKEEYKGLENQIEKDIEYVIMNVGTVGEVKDADLKDFLMQIGELWQRGYEIDWNVLHNNVKRHKIAAPTYCFEKRVFPIGENMQRIFTKLLLPTNGEEVVAIKHDGSDEEELEQIQELAASNEEQYTSTEKKMLELWKEFFELDEIGIDDSFLEIGGDSLRAMSLITEIQEVFGIEIPIEEIFNLTTIAQLAQYIDENQDAQYEINNFEE